MDQRDRRLFLINELLKEDPNYKAYEIPEDTHEQKRLLRVLMNVRPPRTCSEEFFSIQDEYLMEENAQKGVTYLHELTPHEEGIYLWQGDITTLMVDGIVNAANSGMTGCYYPCHGCIDNAIHSSSGIQLRLACDEIIRKQGHPEAAGTAKITPAFNLPSRYVLHTVGPIISGPLTKGDCELLSSCYKSCLEQAEEHKLKSIAFCCISTGEFHFPNEKAAEIAIKAVKEYRARAHSEIEVIFNVFKEQDYKIYKRLLRRY